MEYSIDFEISKYLAPLIIKTIEKSIRVMANSAVIDQA
jgi:hypothetical protein